MQITTLEFTYCGQSFLIDIAEGNMVDLNEIHRIAGSPAGQDPRFWLRKPKEKKSGSTGTISVSGGPGWETLNALAEKLNVGAAHIYKTTRGKGGGTKAHWQLALSYAQYLSPELHLAVNQVFKERLEEMLDPELGIKRSRDRAKKAWARQGKDHLWIATRENGIDCRNGYTDTLVAHDVRPGYELAYCTNKVYTGIFGMDRAKIEETIRAQKPDLPKRVNIRDHAKRSSLMAIGLAEALASEEIEEFDVRGVDGCAKVTYNKAQSVKMALDDARSKAPKRPVQRKFDGEAHMRGIAMCREALNRKPG